ncbi:hypothetical protein BT63DRAFT_380282 [Microthyrium microscopicum]|uniref:Non-specific serine/threonine protein kinase n=1 Tax=Microthyrium microscopicum TaxID=703497 RepID=A0A6A6TW15_9PEZI|nr:hypothetical protein BT63DRAFT_380282 [Microthyrium microscopicum]
MASPAEANLDAYLSRLDDEKLDLKTRGNVATEIRDNLDVWCQSGSPLYSAFLEKSIPVLLKILDSPPVFDSTSPEQRLRACVLDILHRLPATPDLNESITFKLVDKLMTLVRIENEDNDILIVKTLMDLLRHDSKVLKERVQAFLDVIVEMFQMMSGTVEETFDGPSQHQPAISTPGNQYAQSPRPSSPVSTMSTEIGNEQQQSRHLLKGMQSFKVVAECPIIVISLVGPLDRAVTQTYVKKFVPLMKDLLMLQAKPQERAHEEAKARGDIHTGVCKDIKNKAAFGDFIWLQVKTMNFLAYLLRVYTQQLQDFLPSLPAIVVRLLRDIPREKSGARKELFVAVRHIINFNFRKIFLPKLDELLDVRTLIGDGLTVYETMRPLAYSMLADLIHHLRDSLKPEQIRMTIQVYTKNLHDDFPGTSFQTMSAKLLINMDACIGKIQPKEEARHCIIMILNAIADKFAAMNSQFENASKVSKQTPVLGPGEVIKETYMAEKDSPPDWDEVSIFAATPIKTQSPRERTTNPVNDNKFLFKNLIAGLKSLFAQLRNTNPDPLPDADPSILPKNWDDCAFGFSPEEVNILTKLFREGTQAFRYYTEGDLPDTSKLTTAEILSGGHNLPAGSKEEKELLESFATVFHQIDPATFQEIFQSQIGHLFDLCVIHPSLLHIAQFLLASEATSASLCSILFQFLMEHFEEIGSSNVKRASILLRLFKLSSMAVTLYSSQNEQVILPHTTKIITQSIQLSTTAEEPINYFLLLRSLFRSIGGGRFEHLYKEILPLLEMVLDTLNTLLHAARKPSDRDLFVELILTVPARLSHLLPYLSYLMRPLIVALRSGSELVGQGLRTLELCIDNLQQDFIDPLTAPFIEELMTALWGHLKPAPYQHFHSHTAMRILGKLGGRNRKFLTGIHNLDYKAYTDDDASYDIRLVGTTKDRAFPAAIGVDAAITKLKEVPGKIKDSSKAAAMKASDPFHKRQAFKFIQSQTKLFISMENLPDDFAQMVRLQAQDLLAGKVDLGEDFSHISEREKSPIKCNVEHDMLKKLLKALHFAHSLPDLRDEAAAFLTGLCKHFMILEVGRTFAILKHRNTFNVKGGEGPLFIESKVIADAISESLSSDCPEEREAAQASIRTLWESAGIILGNQVHANRITFFVHLTRNFTHACHQEEWYTKMGGVLGLKSIVKDISFSDQWMNERLSEIMRALLFVLKDMSPDLTASPRLEAEAILETVIRRLAKGFKKEDLTVQNSKFYALNKSLVMELAHPVKYVRAMTKKLYHILSEELELSIVELIQPVREGLLLPMFNKPLRALPFGIQIGYVDAINYLMNLDQALVPHEEPLSRLILEALFLADSEDASLAENHNEYRKAESIVQLRVGCIKLLSTVLTYPEYQTAPPNNTKNRIICVFFKGIYMKSPEVVDAANNALKGVISVANKLPKDILQNGLRPILLNLQHPTKLSVESLEGLARLLKLLTFYFKVEIGQRLLDHTKVFMEAPVLQKASFQLIEQNRPMQVVAAIINIFHLLPPTANMFLPTLVTKVLELESALRRTHISPFREPLIRYLNQYPKEMFEYISPFMQDLKLGRFFGQLLAGPKADALRNAVYSEPDKLVKAFVTPSDAADRLNRGVNAIHIAYSISTHEKTKDLLVKSEPLRKALFEAGQSVEKLLRDSEKPKTAFQSQTQVELSTNLRLAAEQAGEQIIDLLMIYMEQEPTNTDFFFEIVDAVTSQRLKNRPSLIKFIYKSMICSENMDYCRTLVLKCITQFRKPSTTQRVKAYLFKNVVNPIFAMDVQRNWDSLFEPDFRNTKLLDKNMITIIHEQLWRPSSVEGNEEISVYVDHSRMELLQLTALLLKYYNHPLQETRKDIIKFGWNWIKLEDVVNKHAAYVVISYFITFYDTPAKISMTVYQSLLKAHQAEGRPLVTQALDLLALVIKKRVATDQHKLPLWARMPKRIIAEEINNLQQLVSIFNFFCRHPDLFYEAREALAPAIIPHLQKIASSNNEGKRTSLLLATLVWTWEERGNLESRTSPTASPSGTKRKSDGSPIIKADQLPPSATCVGNTSLRLMLVKYLAQFAVTLPERYPTPAATIREKYPPPVLPPAKSSPFCQKAVHLLRNFLGKAYWADLNIFVLVPRICKPMLVTDKQDEEKKEAYETKIVNTLQVLKVFVNAKSNEWITEHLSELWTCIEKPLKMEDAQIQDCLHSEGDDSDKAMIPLFRRLLDVIPESPAMEPDDDKDESPGTQFMTSVNSIVTDALEKNNLICGINILSTICKIRPKDVDQHVPALTKVFNTTGKLLKDHILANPVQTPVPVRQDSTSVMEAYDNEVQTGILLKTIDIMAARMESLGEQRRPFLTTLATLLERSRSEPVWNKVLDLAQGWVFNNDVLPTLKEKVAVLSKMLMAEQRPDMQDILQRFFQLVLKVYEDQRVTRTELTVRLEQSFLVGCRSSNVDIRNKFLGIFDRHISPSPNTRLNHVLCDQDWNVLQESFWLSQVIHLLFGSLDMNAPVQLDKEDFKTMSALSYFGPFAKDSRLSDVMVDDKLEEFMADHKSFCNEISEVKLRDIMDPLNQLQHVDRELASSIWIALFPIFWANIPKDERREYESSIAQLLARDFHMRQLDQRPNCIQTLLEGLVRAKPRFKCPPHLAKYLAKTYDAWYVAADFLEEAANSPLVDTPAVRESTLDALLDIYSSLEETDMFYGTWRRRCQYVESNAALSYEQLGMWEKAQRMYEQAQVKARTGALPFSQSEYMLWEDHFVICSQKLQQWDVLADFAKHENFNDLYIEAMWRNPDTWVSTNEREQFDSMIKAVSDALTPRRAFFQAFMAFLKMHYKVGGADNQGPQEFSKSLDEAIQITVRKWHQLPKRITNAHIPLLQQFQHIIELMDAQNVSNVLAQTNLANLDQKSNELKLLFQQWRDRLPNFWDDINTWQDIVTWRMHIFTLVNNQFLPIIQSNNPPNSANPSNQNSHAYRGYHEMAWIINRFAHVARLHNLHDVCITHLGKIYTLPNIEIHEAFLKLREQAKCYYQRKTDLDNGLEVINNTNMNYFGNSQKAQFFTLKGMFLNKLGQKSEANEAFGSALYYEIKLPKAWSEWGRYNDQMFKEDPRDISKASAAVSCYLEAAALYKSKRSRKLLSRILWLLSLDTPERVVAKSMQDYKGEHPIWYWIQFVPQLLLGLNRPEAAIARGLLNKIAKTFPQALFFQLRTTKEDMIQIRRTQEMRENKEKELKAAKDAKAAQQGSPAQGNQSSPKQNGETTPSKQAIAANGANGTPADEDKNSATPNSAPRNPRSPQPKVENGETALATANGTPSTSTSETQLKPWEHADQIMNLLKAQFPLLAWSMESMVDQITKYFKSNLDEDAHRLINALLTDGLSYITRQPGIYSQDNKLPDTTEANIKKFTENICPTHIRKYFEADFVSVKPTMYEYIQRLRKWRNRFEERLDRRPSPIPLETISQHLSEFRFLRLNDVEVPGQYLLHKDKQGDFVKIERFMADVDLVRGPQASHKRLKIRGHDGSIHAFGVYHPTNRHCRREERVIQLFRIFNDTLAKRRETRRRNLQFNLPLMIPFSPSARLVTDDGGYTSLQGVYDDWCRKNSVMKEDPILFQIEKLRALNPKSIDQMNAIRLESFLAITENMVPNTVALEYFQATYPSFEDFWLFRRTFAYQFAALTFINYILFMNQRTPLKLMISRSTGKVWGSESVSMMGAQRPLFNNPEAVAFRLTPNIQMLMGPIVSEGIFAPSLMAIARALMNDADDGGQDMASQLSVFIRDEVTFWFSAQRGASNNQLDTSILREAVQLNTEAVMRRVRGLAEEPKAGNLPANQSVVDLISTSVNPRTLSQMDFLWCPWL